jgi:hypothetical protein
LPEAVTIAAAGDGIRFDDDATRTRLVRDPDVIVIVIVAEDLAVKNMIRNRSLAKAISDCGWGTFRQNGSA